MYHQWHDLTELHQNEVRNFKSRTYDVIGRLLKRKSTL